MAPQTRSRGTAAPPSRVYRSTPPSYQVQFPPRRREVKTYSNRRHSTRSLRQQTLTQIDYLRDVDVEDDLHAMEDDEEGGRGRAQKRRKTMGDVPDSTPSSTFHTQTLTQFLGAKDEEYDGDDLLLVKDSEDEDDMGVDLDGSQKENVVPGQPASARKRRCSPMEDKDKSSRATSIIPQTPAHKKIVAEIQSSQPSPFTPMLDKYSISPHRSPLRSRSTKTEAPAPTVASVTRTKPRRLVIEDTFSPVADSVLSSNPEPSSPPPQDPISCTNVPDDTEIPDSDDEFDGLDTTPEEPEPTEVSSGDREPGTPTPLPRQIVNIQEADLNVEAPTPTPLPNVHLETAPQLTPPRKSTPEPMSEDEASFGSEPVSPSPNRAHKIIFQSSNPEVQKETPLSSPHPNSPTKGGSTDHIEQTQVIGQSETQWLESQRVPLEVIRTLDPQTARSDIILSFHPEHVEEIVAGTKNHEFSNYKIPMTVGRIWIYVTKPVCELRYMATISDAKQPGSIDDKTGIGNAEFNRGAGTSFAYELLQVYQLNNPVPLELMRENGWMEAPPQKYVYVPPAVVGELLANLRCELFPEQQHHEVSGDHFRAQQSSGQISISQEVEKQLRSDIEHCTQLPSDLGEAEIIPFSQGILLPRAESRQQSPPVWMFLRREQKFAKPALPPPRPADVTSGQGTPSGKVRADEKMVPLSQATTASQPTTPTTSPDKSVPRPQLCSSVPSLPEFINDSPIRLPPGAGGSSSMGSSQLLVQDSLVADVRAPPAAWDSEDED